MVTALLSYQVGKYGGMALLMMYPLLPFGKKTPNFMAFLLGRSQRSLLSRTVAQLCHQNTSLQAKFRRISTWHACVRMLYRLN
jgi:SNF family Na+-dependent transporter